VKFGKKTVILLTALGALHAVVLLAGFLSPYDVAEQNRYFPYAPPTPIHFVDSRGSIHLRPSICIFGNPPDAPDEYFENRQQCYPVRFLVRGAEYKLFGFVRANLHLFGVDAPAKIFLMGSDGYGRDVFTRLLYGGQVSLFAGLLATAITLAIGTTLGIFAGYYGGWLDSIVMRGAELFLALPWLYLLFALRAFLPLSLSPRQAFFLVIGVIGVLGWARPARLIRGVVLSTRERHFVLAARLFGASDIYVMRRHILPDVYSIIATQAVLLIPQYVLAEVMLSFLGLGIGEPAASWGNMLATLQQYAVLVSYWWMLIPGLALIPVFLGYSLLTSDLLWRAADRA
jgi:peptide/nickel transport system permease protein